MKTREIFKQIKEIEERTWYDPISRAELFLNLLLKIEKENRELKKQLKNIKA